jgi:hypothetical protein
MPIAQGTPTIEQKVAVALGFGASIGLTPEEITAVQTGEQKDLSTAEQTVVGLFSPILGAAEQAGLADLTQFLTAVAGLGSVTSVSGAANIVNAALSAEAGVMQKQAISLGQTSVTTLISAALAKVGKVNLPLVG